MSSILSKLINLAGNITGVLPVANGGTGVSTSTGTTNVVLSNGPTLVAPVLGTPASGTLSNCTSYPNVTQSVAGLVVSAGQLLGTNTNDTASAGNVGELLTGTLARASAVSFSASNTARNIVASAITLTPGDWVVNAVMQQTVATSQTQMDMAISKTTGTLPSSNVLGLPIGGEYWGSFAQSAGVNAGGDFTMVTPSYDITVATATTLPLFLVGRATYTVGTPTTYGWIQARRVR